MTSLNRIIHYYPDALTGEFGTANAVRGWCLALAKRGLQIILLTDADVKNTVPVPEGVGHFPIRHVGRGRFRSPQRGSLAEFNGDLFVVHGVWSFQNVRAASNQTSPYMIIPHGGYHPSVIARSSATKKVFRLTLEQSHVRNARGLHLFFEQEKRRLAFNHTATIVVPNGFSSSEGGRWDGGSSGSLLWLGRYDVEGRKSVV